MRRAYDGRDLPWKETAGPAGSATERTSITEYDPNGNLRREVRPAGVNELTKTPNTPDDGGPVTPTSEATRNATVSEYSPDNILTARHLPWDKQAAGAPGAGSAADVQNARRFRQDFNLEASGRGRVASIDAPYEWRQNPDGTLFKEGASRTAYTHYDTGWIRSASDPKVTHPDDPTQSYDHALDYEYSARGEQTAWRSDRGRTLTRDYAPNGVLLARTAEQAQTR